jgi:protein-S-isoprenylcysteine O-methyltransferase Ste14
MFMNISKYQKICGVGPFGLIIGLSILAVLWLLDRQLGHVEILSDPEPIELVGLILICMWICWHIWCILTIRQWWLRNQLCTDGPFRIVRHPIYAGVALIGFPGISLMFNSWIMLLAPPLQYSILFVLVRKEESMMAAVFGEEYARYAARTGRLFPRLFR